MKGNKLKFKYKSNSFSLFCYKANAVKSFCVTMTFRFKEVYIVHALNKKHKDENVQQSHNFI